MLDLDAVSKTIVFVCGTPSCDGVRHQIQAIGVDPGPCPGGRTVLGTYQRSICEAIPSMFRPFGYEVQRVFSAAEALDVLRIRPAVYLVEATLNDSDGFELCRQIKRRQPRRPVLILSSERLNLDGKAQAARARADGFLRYPVLPELLENAIWNMLGKPAVASERQAITFRSLLRGLAGD
jgi:CheY-like chemotaxis protein